MISPDIKLKKDSLEVEYYNDVPIEDFIKEMSPNVDNGQVFIEFDDEYEDIENNDGYVPEDNTISFIKRKMFKDGFITEFISFEENPDSYMGFGYKKYDPKYEELASILYLYKTDGDYYVQYKYPTYFKDYDNVLIASGFIDTSIKNYDIEVRDTKDENDDTSFCYGLALTVDDNQLRYDYSGGKLSAGLDFTLITYVSELTEEDLDKFVVGELGTKCLTCIVNTDDVNYVYIKNLETDIEYIYEEIECVRENGKEPLYEYVFLSRCEDGVFYDEHNNVITSYEDNIYNLYIKGYFDKIEEFENNYVKPCGMIKGFPDIDSSIFELDSEISSEVDNLLFNKKDIITPGNIVRRLNKKM